MGYIVDGVEARVQNAFLTATDSVITPKIKIAIMLINASSGQDATSVTANSERGQPIRITAPFENVFESNFTLHVFNTNDETWINIPDEVSELSVAGAHFDRQPQTDNNLAPHTAPELFE